MSTFESDIIDPAKGGATAVIRDLFVLEAYVNTDACPRLTTAPHENRRLFVAEAGIRPAKTSRVVSVP